MEITKYVLEPNISTTNNSFKTANSVNYLREQSMEEISNNTLRKKTILKCKVCGQEYYPKSGSLKQITCSLKCRNEYRKNKTGGKKGKHYTHLQRAEIGVCILCGKTFRAVKDFKWRKQKYCSKECWSKRHPPRIKECIYCQRRFETYENTKIYCSQRCRDLDYRERMKGKNSHLWKDGRTKWTKILRTRAACREWKQNILKRDNGICQKCGAKSDLNIHHVKPISEYKELVYDVSNGIVLCKKCHKKEHKRGSI